MEFSFSEMWPFLFVLATLGLCFGSFSNVLIARMPQDESIGGRSRCPHCGHTLSVRDIVPLLSFLWLQGKCRLCRDPIALTYPVVELLGALAFLCAGWITSFQMISAVPLGLALWAMTTLAIIDARTQMIPDMMTLALAVSALVYQLTIGTPVWSGAILGVSFFALQWIVSRGAWVGSGDILLAGALGLLLGSWRYMLVSLMASYIIGALLVSVLLGLGYLKRNQHVAFGPFLVAGAVVILIAGDWILRVMLPL